MTRTHRALLALAIAVCLSGGATAVSATGVAAPIEDAPRTERLAIQRLGQPSVRQVLPDGGLRLRWVSVDTSALSILRLTTLEFDASGHLTSSDSRRLISPLPSDKGA